MNIIIKKDIELSEDDRKIIKDFLTLGFGSWKEEERINLYFSPTYRHLFLYEDNKLVSYMRIIIREIKFAGKKVIIGGIGDMATHPEYRGRGLGTKLVTEGIKLLKKAGCDIGLLQTNPKKGARLYKQSGFVEAHRSYTFKDAKGRLKNQWKEAVMIAPINSETIFHTILQSKKNFYIGQGDW